MYIHIWNKPVALLIKQSKRIDYLKSYLCNMQWTEQKLTTCVHTILNI